jgi:hypothetical protein
MLVVPAPLNLLVIELRRAWCNIAQMTKPKRELALHEQWEQDGQAKFRAELSHRVNEPNRSSGPRHRQKSENERVLDAIRSVWGDVAEKELRTASPSFLNELLKTLTSYPWINTRRALADAREAAKTHFSVVYLAPRSGHLWISRKLQTSSKTRTAHSSIQQEPMVPRPGVNIIYATSRLRFADSKEAESVGSSRP